jgi:non-specific serine/threonine protein kinase
MDLGVVAIDAGDFDVADSLLDESAELAMENSDERILITVEINRGYLAIQRGEDHRARGLLEEALAIANRVGDSQGRAIVLENLGWALLALGESSLAAGRFCDGLQLWRIAGPVHASSCLDGLSAVAVADGDAERAARLSGISAALHTAGGFQYQPLELRMAEQTERDGRAALGDERWEAGLARGAAMTVEDAVAYALDSSNA